GKRRGGPPNGGPPQRVERLSSEVKNTQRRGELEGAKPASNEIKCPAKPCFARRAAHEVGTFPLLCSGKVTAFLRLRKSLTRLFRQPEAGRQTAARLSVSKDFPQK